MRHLALLATVLACSAATAQVTKSGNTYLFRAKYAKGSKMSYGMNTTSTFGQGQGMKMTSPVTLFVKGVSKGVATLEVTTGPVVMNGKTQGQKDVKTVKVDVRNRPVGGEAGVEGFASFAFPEKAIAPGATWEGSTSMKSPAGEIQLKSKYKFVGVRTVNGKAVAEIQTTMSGANPIPMKGTSTSFILVADGSLLKATAQIGAEVSLGGQGSKPMKVGTTISMTRK